jgi:hypothetical protein
VDTVNMQNKNYFMEWIPTIYQCVQHPPVWLFMASSPPPSWTTLPPSADPREQAVHGLTAMFQRKAFLHWYVHQRGHERMEIIEAESNMNDLITDYHKYQDATVEEYDEEEHYGDGELARRVGVIFVGPANRSRSYPSIHGVTAVRATTGAVRLCPSVEVRAVVASHSHLAVLPWWRARSRRPRRHARACLQATIGGAARAWIEGNGKSDGGGRHFYPQLKK